jgi:hypothetical protein
MEVVLSLSRWVYQFLCSLARDRRQPQNSYSRKIINLVKILTGNIFNPLKRFKAITKILSKKNQQLGQDTTWEHIYPFQTLSLVHTARFNNKTSALCTQSIRTSHMILITSIISTHKLTYWPSNGSTARSLQGTILILIHKRYDYLPKIADWHKQSNKIIFVCNAMRISVIEQIHRYIELNLYLWRCYVHGHNNIRIKNVLSWNSASFKTVSWLAVGYTVFYAINISDTRLGNM